MSKRRPRTAPRLRGGRHRSPAQMDPLHRDIINKAAREEGVTASAVLDMMLRDWFSDRHTEEVSSRKDKRKGATRVIRFRKTG
jgi:hypothetical protein